MLSYVDVLASIISNRAVKTKSGEDFKVIFEYENLAQVEAIGIFATVLKINSALQAAKINYDTNYSGSDRALKTLSFESNIAYVDFESGYYRVKQIWIC
jgi:hypothetical protein